ncbi:hypothetical protein [Mongoliibacter sp.]|uniref:hypothetical protein n=1 Tax=Mongoliibacter sp. TaxID=2022438 RepID=UPI0025EBC15C|nr:hypothetical protein [Mongoliibacter sp.]
MKIRFALFYISIFLNFNSLSSGFAQTERKTAVSIEGEKFHINGKPIFEGRVWNTAEGEAFPIEGLLFNSRMVQGVFDDLNKDTRGQWAYPDTQEWDPDRNTDEFIQAMPAWYAHGLMGFTLNLQGGCPFGYCNNFPWDNSAFNPDGSLRDSFMHRTARILDRADELGMVVILGLFYFGEDQNLKDERAVKNAVRNAVTWVLEKGYSNVIIEINNECSVGAYDHDILKCDRVPELIMLAKEQEKYGRSLYVSTSLAGGHVPTDKIVEASDFILIHGNGVDDPNRIAEISEEIRRKNVYSPKPLVNNEDDIPWRNPNQGWEDQGNNFAASVRSYTGWGFFDFRLPEENELYNQGYQSIPVNWQLSSDRKRDFFKLLAEITGSEGTPYLDLKFSEKIGESIQVEMENVPGAMVIQSFEVIINNQVVATYSELTKELSTKNLENEFLSSTHWIKVRLIYMTKGQEVMVESPYYKNPWWPYGGF